MVEEVAKDLTVRAAARAIGVSPDTVRVLNDDGEFPGAYWVRPKLKKGLRIPQRDVNSYKQRRMCRK